MDREQRQSAARLFDLSGQVALVTGASGGLGRSIACIMADLGAAVVLSDLDERKCREVAASLSDKGHDVLTLQADLANHESVSMMADRARAWRGGVDTLVCCGGIEGHVGSLLDASEADWHRTMDINLRSAIWLSAALAPSMEARGAGSIVLISSIAGLRGNRAIGLYGVAKAGLSQLARNLAVELGPRGVRVNAVAPGLIETPLSRHLVDDERFLERRLAMTPLRRVGQPEEVAGVVAMLAGSAGGYISGQTLVVDGGTLITDGS